MVTTSKCKFTYTNTTSIEENKKNNSNFQISPNPTNGNLTINLTSEIVNPQSEIVIYNILGQVIHQQILNSKQETLNLENHPKGIYLLKIQNEEEIWTEKIVVE